MNLRKTCMCKSGLPLIKYWVRWCKMPYHNKSCHSIIVAIVTLVTLVWWRNSQPSVSLSLSFAAEAIDSDPSRYVSHTICLSVTMCCSHSHVLTTLAAIQQTSALVSWPTVFACSAEIKTAPLRSVTISLNDLSDGTKHNRFHNEAKTSHCGINKSVYWPCACSRVHFCCVVVCSVWITVMLACLHEYTDAIVSQWSAGVYISQNAAW